MLSKIKFQRMKNIYVVDDFESTKISKLGHHHSESSLLSENGFLVCGNKKLELKFFIENFRVWFVLTSFLTSLFFEEERVGVILG